MKKANTEWVSIWSYCHQDKYETWLTVYSLLGETREHMTSKTGVYMCVHIYTCMYIRVYIQLHTRMESWWRQCSRQTGSKRVHCVQMNEDGLFFKVWFKNLGGCHEVKTTFNCVDICTDGTKAKVSKTAGAVARIKEWRPTILVVTLVPTATHSRLTEKKVSFT